jgi:hypothetical protein
LSLARATRTSFAFPSATKRRSSWLWDAAGNGNLPSSKRATSQSKRICWWAPALVLQPSLFEQPTPAQPTLPAPCRSKHRTIPQRHCGLLLTGDRRSAAGQDLGRLSGGSTAHRSMIDSSGSGTADGREA